jgi:hypothetical protein
VKVSKVSKVELQRASSANRKKKAQQSAKLLQQQEEYQKLKKKIQKQANTRRSNVFNRDRGSGGGSGGGIGSIGGSSSGSMNRVRRSRKSPSSSVSSMRIIKGNAASFHTLMITRHECIRLFASMGLIVIWADSDALMLKPCALEYLLNSRPEGTGSLLYRRAGGQLPLRGIFHGTTHGESCRLLGNAAEHSSGQHGRPRKLVRSNLCKYSTSSNDGLEF